MLKKDGIFPRIISHQVRGGVAEFLQRTGNQLAQGNSSSMPSSCSLAVRKATGNDLPLENSCKK
jgi:hypothetical protein